MRMLVIGCFLLAGITAAAQDTVSLATCYEKAREHYPSARNRLLYQQASDLRLKNIANTWFPQFTLGAQSTYQSDVTHVTIPFPGISIPTPNKDQYKLSLDINQSLYDGGLSKRQKELEKASNLTDLQQLEVELYQLRERVNGIYFSILLLESNEKLLVSMKKSIDEKMQSMESAVKNGIVTPSEKDVLEAESLKTAEKIYSVQQDRNAAIDMLNEVTGEKFGYNKEFLLPASQLPDTTAGVRPEQVLYDLQMQKLDRSIQLTGSKTLPRLNFFTQLGYANPALNMLSNKFDSYYLVGATLRWNFWDWNSSRHDKEVLRIQKDIVADQKSVFEMNKDITLKSAYASIMKYQNSVAIDSRQVELRQSIARASSVKLSSGTITASDYVNDLDAQVQAELNLDINRISMIQSMIDYTIIKGEK